MIHSIYMEYLLNGLNQPNLEINRQNFPIFTIDSLNQLRSEQYGS